MHCYPIHFRYGSHDVNLNRFFFPSPSSVCVFQAQVAFLQGERKGQENMKQDLVRRIKMLEYALKQERYDKCQEVLSLSLSVPIFLCLHAHLHTMLILTLSDAGLQG